LLCLRSSRQQRLTDRKEQLYDYRSNTINCLDFNSLGRNPYLASQQRLGILPERRTWTNYPDSARTDSYGASLENFRSKKEDGAMNGATEIIKGRIEEAPGVLIGSDKLRIKGQIDQIMEQVKRTGEEGVRQTKKSVQKDTGQN